jgi:hypothetical protein
MSAEDRRVAFTATAPTRMSTRSIFIALFVLAILVCAFGARIATHQSRSPFDVRGRFR